jgi:hypothetical protein
MIRIRIERVVLDGVRFAAGEAQQFQTALVQELTELLRTDGLPSGIAGGAVPRAAAPAYAAPASPRPASLARSVAASVYQALGQTR